MGNVIQQIEKVSLYMINDRWPKISMVINDKFHGNLLVMLQLLVSGRQVVTNNNGIKNGLSGCMQFTPENGARIYRDSMGQSDAGENVNLGSSKYNLCC